MNNYHLFLIRSDSVTQLLAHLLAGLLALVLFLKLDAKEPAPPPAPVHATHVAETGMSAPAALIVAASEAPLR